MASTWPLLRNWQSAEQRQICYEACEAGAAAIERERARIEGAANEARSEAAKQQPRTEDGRRLAPKSGDRTISAATSPHSDKGREAKATLAGTT